MKDCNVAVAQIKVSDNAEKNTEKILKYIKKASSKGADLVIFPETSVYVYSETKPKNFDWYIKQIKQACKENRIWCIFSSYVSYKTKEHNTAFLIDRKGKVVYRYNKQHLYGEEKKYVLPGTSNKVITTEFGKIGIIICLDMAFPEDSKKLSDKGAWIIFCPTFEVDWKDYSVPKALPVVRAYENACYFVVCDTASKRTASISTIADPRKILKRISKKEGMIMQKLDYSKIKQLRDSENIY